MFNKKTKKILIITGLVILIIVFFLVNNRQKNKGIKPMPAQNITVGYKQEPLLPPSSGIQLKTRVVPRIPVSTVKPVRVKQKNIPMSKAQAYSIGQRTQMSGPVLKIGNIKEKKQIEK